MFCTVLLAQVVVDAENLVRGEELVDHMVQLAGGLEIVPEGLLDDHPVPGVLALSCDIMPFELGDHLLEVRRWD